MRLAVTNFNKSIVEAWDQPKLELMKTHQNEKLLKIKHLTEAIATE